MAFGVTTSGFIRKRLSDSKTELENLFKVKFGQFINLLPSSVFSQLIGIISDREQEIWEMAEAVYNSQYPDTADGASLDNVASITGQTRKGPAKSRVIGVSLYGTVGTLIPAGTQLSVLGNSSAKFLTDTDQTLAIGTDEVQNISWAIVPTVGGYKLKYNNEETAVLAFNANAAAIQTALNDLPNLSGVVVTGNYGSGFVLTFGGADGKTPHPELSVVSNTTGETVTVSTPTPGVSQAEVDCTATENGPIQAPFRTLSVIDTPVSGFTGASNMSDAVIGRLTETDLEFRLRRAETLQVAGAATVEAIRSRLLNLAGVTDVIVFENITTVVDGNGRPPKSFESVVAGGLDQEIRDELWLAKPAGIETYGTVSGLILDSQGQSHTIKFSRPTLKAVYLDITITKDGNYPLDGDNVVENAIIEYINNLGIGRDIIVYPQLICAFGDIPGILDIVVKVGFSPSPTLDDNLIIAPNEIAFTDTAKVAVTSV